MLTFLKLLKFQSVVLVGYSRLYGYIAEILSETQFEPGAHFLDFCFTTQFATRRAHSC